MHPAVTDRAGDHSFMDRIQLASEPPGPVPRPPHSPPSGEPLYSEVQDDSLVDTQLLVDWLGFVARSVWRHRILAVATCLVAFGAVWILAAQWPKTYLSYGRLLVTRNDVMSSLVNPGRTIPREDGAPTWAAQEIVRSRQNLLAIMEETNLLEEWERSRTPLLRLKDWMVGLVRGPATETGRVEALAGLMEERIQVTTDDEGIVSFTVRWPNASMAYQLVDKAMRNFLEYRRVSEASAIEDSIAILDRSVGELETQVNRTIADLRRRERAPTPRRQVRTPPPAPARQVSPPLPAGPSAESTVRLARLKSALEARQQEIVRLSEARAQQMAETQANLLAAQTVYTEGHPTVLALRQTMAQLSRESPELAAARREAETLASEYDLLSTRVTIETENAERARAAMSQQATATPPPVPAVPAVDVPSPVNEGDPSEPVSLRLRVEMAQLAAVRERANAARAELSSSQEGFKHQFSILRPAQLPRQPVAPNMLMIYGAGFFASVLLALAVVLLVDLAGGRILEVWQVERQVGVPVSLRIPKV